MSIAPRCEDFAGLFALFDLNGDGWISADEVERVLASMAGVVAAADGEALRDLVAIDGRVTLAAFSLWAQG